MSEQLGGFTVRTIRIQKAMFQDDSDISTSQSSVHKLPTRPVRVSNFVKGCNVLLLVLLGW